MAMNTAKDRVKRPLFPTGYSASGSGKAINGYAPSGNVKDIAATGAAMSSQLKATAPAAAVEIAKSPGVGIIVGAGALMSGVGAKAGVSMIAKSAGSAYSETSKRVNRDINNYAPSNVSRGPETTLLDRGIGGKGPRSPGGGDWITVIDAKKSEGINVPATLGKMNPVATKAYEALDFGRAIQDNSGGITIRAKLAVSDKVVVTDGSRASIFKAALFGGRRAGGLLSAILGFAPGGARADGAV